MINADSNLVQSEPGGAGRRYHGGVQGGMGRQGREGEHMLCYVKM